MFVDFNFPTTYVGKVTLISNKDETAAPPESDASIEFRDVSFSYERGGGNDDGIGSAGGIASDSCYIAVNPHTTLVSEGETRHA